MNSGRFWRILLAAACGTLAAAVLLLSGCPQALDAPTVSYFLEEFEFGKLFITGAGAGKIYTAEIYDYNGSITKYADYSNAVRSDRKLRAGTLASGNAGRQLEIPLENIRGNTAALKGAARFVSVMENDGERVKTFYKAGVLFDNDGRAAVSLAAMNEALFPVTLGNLTDLLESPRPGAQPYPYFIKEVEEYTGSEITWTKAENGSPAGAAFSEGVQYQAEVTMTPKRFFTFNALNALNALNNGQNDNFFSYDGAESVTYTSPDAGGSVKVTIRFSDTVEKPVDDFNLSSYFPPPVKGSPVKTTTGNPPQYTGVIDWTTSDGTPFGGLVFAGSMVYKAVVTLTAKTGYTFTGVKADSFKYDYAEVKHDPGSGDTITITVTFPATEPSDVVVTDLNLTDLVQAPVTGEAPVKSGIDTNQYTGEIGWKILNGESFAGNAFAGSTVYRAVVTLTAKPGYTFTGVAEDSFTHSGATEATNEADSGTVIITFPATAATVTLFDLSDKITPPVAGEAPVTTRTATEQYTVSVEWQTDEGEPFNGQTFAASTVYKAVVTLTAKTGYTFTGVAADGFEYTGATAVTNEADSGTVIITFPVTDATVTLFDLSGKVTPPAAGAAAAASEIETVQYTGTVTWQTDEGTPLDGQTFAASTVYKAVVTLTAKPGYTFTGMAADSFTHSGATAATNPAGSGIVTLRFTTSST